ncbi:acetyl-CoA C-acetyltransferase [Paraburkholderia elongata]|uniref:Acetyl-CoA C-acetyltransferase n=1 Tax=Paraburkholderia elongata TaxID=2675747 RepID=A0A972SIW9_9BURK|nr:acetyl-CoA C-acetyltransferase [Paraburkholderia elongata]NPT56412.1 acetyl-CoA C-acetyltransferase [Paraburkholderia elongata]
MTEALIYDHVRTPRGRGRAGGALHAVTPVELASQVLIALKDRNRLDTHQIDDVGLGIVMPVGEQGADLTRFALLNAGYGEHLAGYQINRFCTSALDAVNQAAGVIQAGHADAAIGGGVESMSRVPIGSDGGACYTDPRLAHQFPYMPNGVAADLMAALGGFSRGDVDSYAAESQRRADLARSSGHFAASLVVVRDVLGEPVLAHDEAIRPGITVADLAKLAPAFVELGEAGYDAIAQQRYPHLEKIDHIHTSGNSSGIVDGASAVLLGNRAFGERNGLRPRARIRGYASGASEPLLSLGGPMPVTEKLLSRLGMTVDDIDLFEINEAFAVVPMCYMQTFDIPFERVNVSGGAIALGHPLGATGAMLFGTLLDELERRDLNIGLVTLCAAAGQATATIIERI